MEEVAAVEGGGLVIVEVVLSLRSKFDSGKSGDLEGTSEVVF